MVPSGLRQQGRGLPEQTGVLPHLGRDSPARRRVPAGRSRRREPGRRQASPVRGRRAEPSGGLRRRPGMDLSRNHPRVDELEAGTDTFSLRPSTDGENLLPGSDITTDRFDLYDVTDGEFARYPSVDARLSAGAALSYEDPATAGAVQLEGEAQATYYAAVAETGYYDV